jgi:sugar phosphate isomerase/epimerase
MFAGFQSDLSVGEIPTKVTMRINRILTLWDQFDKLSRHNALCLFKLTRIASPQGNAFAAVKRARARAHSTHAVKNHKSADLLFYRRRYMTLKLSAALSTYGSWPDRYCPEGYRDPLRTQERLAAVAKIKGVKGIEISQNDVTPEFPAKELKRVLKEYGLTCTAVSADLAHERRFAAGAFAHQHPKTRNAAIDEGRKAVETARAMGCSNVTIRLFSDGFDYPFHIDYPQHWNTLISSIKTIAKFASPDVNVAIAYKPREPRKFLTIGSVGKALSLCQEIAMKNVGVALDFSYALMAGENPAESIAFLARSNKLFEVYFSDNYGLWDDMLTPGSVHLWETMEALLSIRAAKHKGYLTINVVPQRMDPSQACQIAVGNLSILWKKLDKLDTVDLKKAQKTLDAVESQKLIRRVMLQG